MSGTVGEERAVVAMRAGAHDVVLKDQLARLAPAVERELRDCAERAARRAAEATVRAQEARFRALVENVPDVIWTRDAAGRVHYVSPNVEALTGFSPAAFVREGEALVLGRAHPDDLPPLRAATDALLRDGVPMDVDYRFQRRDGRWVVVRNRASAARDVDGARYIDGISTDVTERRSLEAQLRQAQKMEAVGRLASGVAHDFNNLLTVVLSYAELALGELRSDEPLRDDIAEIKAAGTRAAALTQQLLAFSRQQVLSPRVVDLADVVAGTERMLRRILGEDVELTLLGAPGAARCLVDPGQVEQVVMNLVVNARDAMPAGGRLTLETSAVELDAAHAADHLDVAPGAYALLSVSDTGCGMDKATQARIFEPFFTTKGVGKGTGLGLSTVFGIVRQSGGHLRVDSEPGVGTTFEVYLPCVAVDAEPSTEAAPAKSARRGTETVLVVEDEEAVRVIVRDVLRRCGYRVLEAANADDALLQCEGLDPRIDLLVTDVVMPRMGGRQLVERLAPLHPGMRVLYMSGYTGDAIVQHGVPGGVAFLAKPVTPSALLQKVRRVLDAPRGG